MGWDMHRTKRKADPTEIVCGTSPTPVGLVVDAVQDACCSVAGAPPGAGCRTAFRQARQ